MPDIYFVTEQGERELERIRDKVAGLSGPRVSNTPTGIAIGNNRATNKDIAGRQWPILVTVTSTGSNGATWKEVTPTTAGGVELVDGGLTDEDLGAAFELNGDIDSVNAGSGTTGAQVWLQLRPDSNGAIVPMFDGAVRGFVVNLSGPTGSNGTQTSAPTYTYTVKTVGGTQLGTGMSPEVSRPYGAVTAAAKGLAYRYGGTVHLLIAFEVPGSGNCGT
jgi:hypothetical protein